MRASFSHLNELWGFLVVEELVRTGITNFCLSSGARSTPLTFAVSQQKQTTPVVHFDERGSAFYALGHARATGKPAAVIGTSGTAAANFMPAIVEASVGHMPLIILTADRPPEARQSGANQTIDQVKLFGNYVRWHMDVPCPDEKIPPEFVLTTVDQAVYRSQKSPAGPVHLNFMFREPLAPSSKKQAFAMYLKSVAKWMKSRAPYTDYELPQTGISPVVIKEIAKIVSKSKSGLIVAGKLRSSEGKKVLALAEKIGWPVFPDIASGLRLGVKSEMVVPYFDQLLLSGKSKILKPDTIMHFGSQPVSKRLLQFLDEERPANYIRIVDCPDRLDPNHQVTLRIEMDISKSCEQIIADKSKSSMSPSIRRLKDLNDTVDKALTKMLESEAEGRITEPAVIRLISRDVPSNGALFLANSLPVREMDMFASGDGNAVPVEYNRGASGIDGTIASAIGYANGLKTHVTLLIGDLAFLHDLNSLALVKQSKYPVTMVVINNDGGGIFSFLPVVEIGRAYEKFFSTPHGLTFQKAAEQFGIVYYHPRSLNEFSKNYKELHKSKRSAIVEITTNRKANWQLHQQISQTIVKALAKA